MNQAMRLMVIVQRLWTRHGFWVGVALLLGATTQTDASPASAREAFWYRVFLPLNAALTVRMLYQCVASRAPAVKKVGEFLQQWAAWWLAHLLGCVSLAFLGRSAMALAPGSAFGSPLDALGLLLLTLAGVWFFLAALILPLRFVAAVAQAGQRRFDRRRRRAKTNP